MSEIDAMDFAAFVEANSRYGVAGSSLVGIKVMAGGWAWRAPCVSCQQGVCAKFPFSSDRRQWRCGGLRSFLGQAACAGLRMRAPESTCVRTSARGQGTRVGRQTLWTSPDRLSRNFGRWI